MTRFQLHALAALMLVSSTAIPALAQSTIIDDGSLGVNGGGLAVSSGTVTIPENLGARMGNNLFHSFTQFDVGAGETANFQGASTIQNVIARVSGTGASQIDGTIDTKTAMPGANFFLMNPNGISFGSGAALNVGGSVLFTTADEIGFTDGKSFPATIPVTPDLSSVAANRFGFLSQSPGDITFGGSKLHIRETHYPDVPGPAPGVTLDPVQQAKPRQSLTAIGGDVTLPAGTEISSTALNLIAVGNRSATVPAGPRNINLDATDYLSKPIGEALGSVAITLGEHYLDGEVIRVMGGSSRNDQRGGLDPFSLCGHGRIGTERSRHQPDSGHADDGLHRGIDAGVFPRRLASGRGRRPEGRRCDHHRRILCLQQHD